MRFAVFANQTRSFVRIVYDQYYRYCWYLPTLQIPILAQTTHATVSHLHVATVGCLTKRSCTSDSNYYGVNPNRIFDPTAFLR